MHICLCNEPIYSPQVRRGYELLLVTQMFPGVVMAIPLYILMEQFGLLNSISGLALAYASTAVPFARGTSKDTSTPSPKSSKKPHVWMEHHNGSSSHRLCCRFPSRSCCYRTLLFMTAWNEFILAQTFISDETAYTLPVLLNSFVGDYNTEWGKFAAGAIIASVPVMLLFFMLQRYLVEGLTAGAVKG